MATTQAGSGFDITRLKEFREKARLTQAQLAEKAGVHVISISLWENGKSKKPYQSTLAKLEAALSACFREGLPPAMPTKNRPADSIRIVCPHCGASSYSLADIPGVEYKCVSCSRDFKVDGKGRGYVPKAPPGRGEKRGVMSDEGRERISAGQLRRHARERAEEKRDEDATWK